MNRYTFARASIVICVLGFAFSVYGQDKDKAPTEIIYTGKFLGYARVPSLQTYQVD